MARPRPRRPGARGPAENPHPPRYRLMTAAAAIPQRRPVLPSESFERECPACGRVVEFTQTYGDEGIVFSIEDHDCEPDGADGADGA